MTTCELSKKKNEIEIVHVSETVTSKLTDVKFN